MRVECPRAAIAKRHLGTSHFCNCGNDPNDLEVKTYDLEVEKSAGS
jgi:hypothetical protein